MTAPSSMMTMAAASMPAGSATTTITAHAGCPSGSATDVMVTRSDVPVPSCEAGKNATKPSIVSMSGYGPPVPSGGMGVAGMNSTGMGGNGTMTGTGMGGNGTRTGTGSYAQFTGAAGKTAVSGAMVVLGGVAAWLL